MMGTKTRERPAKKTKAAIAVDQFPLVGLAKISEAAAFLNTSKFTVYRLVNAKKLPAIFVGGTLRIEWESLWVYRSKGEKRSKA